MRIFHRHHEQEIGILLRQLRRTNALAARLQTQVHELGRELDAHDVPEPAVNIASQTADLTSAAIRQLPEGPELSAGLSKLREAKDHFVKAALA